MGSKVLGDLRPFSRRRGSTLAEHGPERRWPASGTTMADVQDHEPRARSVDWSAQGTVRLLGEGGMGPGLAGHLDTQLNRQDRLLKSPPGRLRTDDPGSARPVHAGGADPGEASTIPTSPFHLTASRSPRGRGRSSWSWSEGPTLADRIAHRRRAPPTGSTVPSAPSSCTCTTTI